MILSNISQMDNAAVLRWLDDIGLPQHKEAFHNAKIDGRVLHRLTTEDLINLGVTAQLHAASLRRGIQVFYNVIIINSNDIWIINLKSIFETM